MEFGEEVIELSVLPQKTLIYDDDLDVSLMENVLFIDSNVNSTFVESCNTNTFPIVYSRSSSKEELLSLLQSKFTVESKYAKLLTEQTPKLRTIKRFAFAFHFSENPYFLDTGLFDAQNTQFMVDMIQTFRVSNIDFLACDTLLYDNWKLYYELLRSQTNVIVGASDDKTGNLRLGGDWEMESTKENVQTIYFNDTILDYNSLLITYQVDTLTYSVAGTDATVAGYVSTILTHIVIPSTVTIESVVYNVTSIANAAFGNSGGFTTIITIPSSVTSVGNDAFRNSAFKYVTILGNNLTSIGNYAFSWGDVTTINIPDSVLTIGNNAFERSKLSSIIIPNSVTSIGSSAWNYNLALTSVSIGTGVKTIGTGAFSTNPLLRSVSIQSQLIEILNSYLFLSCPLFRDFVIPASVTSIGQSVFDNCFALTSIIIPPSVKIIGNNAFANSGLMNVSIPSSVTSIGTLAFQKTKLTDVFIPSAVNSIGAGAFYANYLTNITVDASNAVYSSDSYGVLFNKSQTTILQYPLGNNTRTTYQVPRTVSALNSTYFSSPYFTSITVDPSNTSFSDASGILFNKTKTTLVLYPFAKTDTSYTIPSTVTVSTLITNPFLTSVTIPTSVRSLGALTNCTSLQSITIPDSVTLFASNAFSGCASLQTVSLGTGLPSIFTSAFQNCTSLTAVNIPSAVRSVGNNAFQNCSNLAEVTFTIPASVTTIGNSSFQKCAKLTAITIPDVVKIIEQAAFSGCASLPYVAIPNSVKNIIRDAFAGCTSLTSVSLPTDLSGGIFPSYMFLNCTSLRSITIPDNITSFAPFNTFFGCTSLTSVTLPMTVTDLGSGTFWNCTSLQQITLPTSLKLIGKEIFSDCNFLSIDIPPSVTSIISSAFSNNYSLTSVTIPESVTFLGDKSFLNCTSLTSIVIPNSVHTIDRLAFQLCTSLTSVSLGNVQNIGKMSFEKCSALTSIVIPSSLVSIGDIAFRYCSGLENFYVDISNANYSDSSGVLFNKSQSLLMCYPIRNGRTTYEIPATVTVIDLYAFDGCSEYYGSVLANVVVPNSVISQLDSTSLKALSGDCDFTITLDIGNNSLVFPTKTTQISIVNTRLNSYRIYAADGSVLQESLYAEVPFTYDGVTIAMKMTTFLPMQLVFTDFLDLAMTLSYDGTLPQLSVATPIGQYTLERDISLSTMKSAFYFQTDDPITYDASFTKYFVDISGWSSSTLRQDINPMNYKVLTTGNGAFGPNLADNLGKHFLRYIASQLFGTYLGVDLFENEDEVYADISTNVLNFVETPILEKLRRVDKHFGQSTFYPGDTSSVAGLYRDSSGCYMTDSEESYNICRNLVKQIASNNNSKDRFQSLELKSGEGAGYGVYHVPFISGDSIYYSVIVSPGPDQHAVTKLTGSIESRKYILKLNII